MTAAVKTIVYPVRDIDAAKKMYAAVVGAEPDVDQPYYVGWNVDGQDVGLDPNGHANGMSGPVAYWHVDDIAATLDALLAAGGTTQNDVKDVGGGKLIATVKDADGNIVGLLQAPAGGWA